MGMIELVILLITILTVGQYLYGWAAYIEKQIVLVSIVYVSIVMTTNSQYCYGISLQLMLSYNNLQIIINYNQFGIQYELKDKRDEKIKKSKGKKTHQQLEAEVAYYEFIVQSKE